MEPPCSICQLYIYLKRTISWLLFVENFALNISACHPHSLLPQFTVFLNPCTFSRSYKLCFSCMHKWLAFKFACPLFIFMTPLWIRSYYGNLFTYCWGEMCCEKKMFISHHYQLQVSIFDHPGKYWLSTNIWHFRAHMNVVVWKNLLLSIKI